MVGRSTQSLSRNKKRDPSIAFDSERKCERISKSIKSLDGTIEVVPFRRDEEVMSLTWSNELGPLN